ncbi:MAG: hypothetical protein V1816_24270 [Pseudomonadota bacterium]
MRKAWIFFSFLLVLSQAAVGLGFDCKNIPFGSDLGDINQDGYFVKYAEKAGVSFYNYTGPCRMALHEDSNAAISYAFVGNKIYARIIRTFNDSLEKIEKTIICQAGAPDSRTQSGDWVVFSWNYPEKELKSKLKFNTVTRETKSVVYYEPLRKMLGQGHGTTAHSEFLLEQN